MPPSAAKPASGPTGDNAQKVSQADLQPDAPDQYTVVKGDTLWGIAGRFLKDPWKWPQIWQMNQDQIKNPHLIYPGDVIRLDRNAAGGPRLSVGGSGGTEAEAASNVVKLDPRVRVERLEAAIPTIPGAAISAFLTAPLVVEANGLDNAPAILATEENRVVVGAGDMAYADRIGAADPLNWQIYRPGAAIKDPDTGETLGYEARYVGDARVRRFGHPTTLQVTKARQEINKGDRLQPAREALVPNYVPRAPDKPVKATVIGVEGGVLEFGLHQVITLNRGARDGLEVGHVLALARRGPVVSISRDGDFYTGFRSVFGLDMKPNPVVPEPPQADVSQDPKVGRPLEAGPITLPDERVGLVFVFRVFDRISYGLVMRATRPMYMGDYALAP